MYFIVLPRFGSPPHSGPCAGLHVDGWDDFGYKTLYQLSVYDDEGIRHRIGGVKIGQFGMEEGRISIPAEFDELDERYFSLGLDESYYEGLNKLGPSVRDRVLRGLQDLSLNPDLFDRALKEKVTGVSLLRSVMPATVTGQYARLARGGARLSSYHFTYSAPKFSGSKSKPNRITLWEACPVRIVGHSENGRCSATLPGSPVPGRVTVPFHSGAILHPKIIKQTLEMIDEAAESSPSEE